jgi:hypothetical protein
MKAIQAALALSVALCAAPLIARAQAEDLPPTWAYAVNPPDFKVKPDDGAPRHVPDSTAAFTVSRYGIFSSRSIGILLTTQRCRISSLMAASRT